MSLIRFCAVLVASLVFAGLVSAQPVNRVPGGGYQGTDGATITSCGFNRTVNITAATVIRTGAGRICKVSIIVLGSTAASVNDAATTGTAAQANQVLAIPASTAAGTIYSLDMPVTTGIVVTPGTSGVIAISYN